jgi:hypothetical protein
MSKLAYVFIFVVIGLALLLHALDERSDREVIGYAASIALHDGVMQACDNRNRLRDGIWTAAAALHPDARRDVVRKTLNYENCDELALKSVERFRKQLRDKEAADSLLQRLTGQE